MSSRDISERGKDVIADHVPTENRREHDSSTKETAGLELHRTTSTLSRIATRFSTRDIVDPGPPPDGGFQAWSQVAAGFMACFSTWFVGFRKSGYTTTDMAQGIHKLLGHIPDLLYHSAWGISVDDLLGWIYSALGRLLH